jgi:glycogen operon protein
VVSRAKLIAEPWDVGQTDSDDLGRFPPLWREWNGRYRDVMRDSWRSQGGLLGEFASRFSGSSDLYRGAGKRPTASVNFITAHDGFTLADLVSYNTKQHNEANGEANRDGTDDNRSWNCGTEGPTTDPVIIELRQRQRRALLTTCCCHSGCRCYSAATNSDATSTATTTPTAKTTRSPGSIGALPTSSSSTSPRT